jgi:hypothetical protein
VIARGMARQVMFRIAVNPFHGGCGKGFPVFHAPSHNLARHPLKRVSGVELRLSLGQRFWASGFGTVTKMEIECSAE